MSRRAAKVSSPAPAPAIVRVERTHTHRGPSHAITDFRTNSTLEEVGAPWSFGVPSFFARRPDLKTRVQEDKYAASAKKVEAEGNPYHKAKSALTSATKKFASGQSYDSSWMEKACMQFKEEGDDLLKWKPPKEYKPEDERGGICAAPRDEDTEAKKAMQDKDAQKKREKDIQHAVVDCVSEVNNMSNAVEAMKKLQSQVSTDRAEALEKIKAAVVQHKKNLDSVNTSAKRALGI